MMPCADLRMTCVGTGVTRLIIKNPPSAAAAAAAATPAGVDAHRRPEVELELLPDVAGAGRREAEAVDHQPVVVPEDEQLVLRVDLPADGVVGVEALAAAVHAHPEPVVPAAAAGVLPQAAALFHLDGLRVVVEVDDEPPLRVSVLGHPRLDHPGQAVAEGLVAAEPELQVALALGVKDLGEEPRGEVGLPADVKHLLSVPIMHRHAELGAFGIFEVFLIIKNDLCHFLSS